MNLKRLALLILASVLLVSCVSPLVFEETTEPAETKDEADTTVELPLGESMITLPSGATGKMVIASEEPSPFVIMFHGYGSTKDEVGNMYLDEAAALQEKGISSLRIGYRGWDEDAPEFDQAFISVDTMLEDAQEALDFVQSLPNADQERIGVLGFSMGGGMVMLLAGVNPDDIAAAATWSSSIDFRDLVNEGDKETARQEGAVTIDLGWRTITHSKEFVDSSEAYDPMTSFAAYMGPLLVVDGTDDYLHANVAVIQELRPDADIYEIEGADHIYHVLTDDASMAQDAIATTATWFESTLANSE